MIDKSAPFSSASSDWLTAHTPYIKERTLRDYEQYRAALASYFGETPLSQIGTIDAVRAFQAWRSRTLPGDGPCSKYRHSAGNVRIKNEVNSVLKPILREA